MEDDWISIHRKFKDWQWYKNINVKTLFLHLLLKANFKDNYWKDVFVKRGQFITSIEHLAEETGLTVQQTRTALSKLKSTHEITIKTTSKYSLITIEKYDFYQRNNKKATNTLTNEITNNQQTNNKQITTNNNDNNILFILFNKYMSNFSFMQTAEEKQKLFKETCMQDEQFKELTKEQQTQLYTKLLSKM